MATGSLTSLENLQLAILAHQCPFNDGAVVYNARVFYSLVNSVVVNYNDAYCTQIGFSFRTNSDSTNNSNTENDNLYGQLVNNENLTKQKFKPLNRYNLYPNPAQNYVNIRSYFNNELVKIKVSNAEGKILVQKDLLITNNIGTLELDLINGIYFIEITNANNKYAEYKKLVIAK